MFSFLLTFYTFLFFTSYELLFFQQQNGETPPVDSMLSMINALICSGFLCFLSFNCFLNFFWLLFSFLLLLLLWFLFLGCSSNFLTLIILNSLGGLFDMPVFMHTWEELLVEGMILNLLHIHSFSYIKAGYRGKVIRYLHLFIFSSSRLLW